MRNKILKILIWMVNKLRKEPNKTYDAHILNDKMIVPDHLSGETKKIMIEFDEPVLPARVMENVSTEVTFKNELPDRKYTFYEVDTK